MISTQTQATSRFCIHIDDDLGDVCRLQRDIIDKASTRKFNPIPAVDTINLVAIDVSELQLAMVDLGDCLLAAGGNSLVVRHCHQGILREGVVGVFETISGARRTVVQTQWIAKCQQVPGDAPHPRAYLHGVVFLFRNPPGTDALSYRLRSTLVWNPSLIPASTLRAVASELYRVIPQSYR
jgi:hypothetical protein